MGKLLKVIGISVGLIIVALIVLPLVIDPNDYREEIISAVEKNTGRKLSIDGDMKLSLFPSVGFDISRLSLGNAKDFGDEPFAAISQAAIHVRLLPLLSSKLEADTITLSGLQLNLAKNSQGQGNWEDLVQASPAESSDKTQTTVEDSAETSGSGLAALSIGGININNARITWKDESTGQSSSIEEFHLNSGSIEPGKPIDLSLGFSLTSSEPEITAALNLAGQIIIDEAAQQLRISGLKITLDATGKPFNGRTLKAALNTDAKLSMDGQSVALDNLVLEADQLRLQGKIDGNHLNTEAIINAEFQLAEINLRQWLAKQGISLPEMSSDTALSSFSTRLKLTQNGKVTNIHSLELKLDESLIKGDVKLTGPHIGFNLNLDKINLDHYLPAPATKPESDKPVATPAETATTGDEPLIPVDTLKPLDIEGSFTIGHLVVNRVKAEQLEIKVKALNGKLEIDKQIGRFYQGSFNGVTKLDVAGNTPRLAIVSHLKNVKIGELLKDLAQQDKLSGTGKFNANITAKGNSVNAIKKALNGSLDFRFENGAVKGFNLAKILRETKARFKGQTLPPSTEPAQTDFSELSGSAVIKNGIVNNQDLLAKSPYLRVKGSGKADLVKEELEYLVETAIVSTSKGQGGAGLEELKGLNIPVHLTGKFSSPDYKIDWKKVLVGSQKAKINKKIEAKKQQYKEKLQNKLQNSLGNKLQGFF